MVSEDADVPAWTLADQPLLSSLSRRPLEVPPRQSALSEQLKKDIEAFWRMAHTDVLNELHIRSNKAPWLPRVKQDRAKQRVADLAARKAAVNAVKTKNKAATKQPRQQRKLPSLPRGAPTFTRADSCTSLWRRVADCYWELLQRQRSADPLKGVRVEDWQKKVTPKHVDSAAAARALSHGTLLSSAITKATGSAAGRAAMHDAACWERRQNDSLNHAIARSIRYNQDPNAQLPRLRRPLGAGLYIAVILHGGRLVGVYSGRSKCLWYRFGEHWVKIVFEDETWLHLHFSAQSAVQVLFFDLFEDASDERFEGEAATERAIMEGLRCLSLSWFREQDSYLGLRREFGLEDLGWIGGFWRRRGRVQQ